MGGGPRPRHRGDVRGVLRETRAHREGRLRGSHQVPRPQDPRRIRREDHRHQKRLQGRHRLLLPRAPRAPPHHPPKPRPRPRHVPRAPRLHHRHGISPRRRPLGNHRHARPAPRRPGAHLHLRRSRRALVPPRAGHRPPRRQARQHSRPLPRVSLRLRPQRLRPLKRRRQEQSAPQHRRHRRLHVPRALPAAEIRPRGRHLGARRRLLLAAHQGQTLHRGLRRGARGRDLALGAVGGHAEKSEDSEEERGSAAEDAREEFEAEDHGKRSAEASGVL
mmetsp:Transcript_6569/g.17069  ORF Transcript_6569/g.17069 Transcript_6569/m.17069 type:complete len:276 (-) Transcript_6569:204-1031(-)